MAVSNERKAERYTAAVDSIHMIGQFLIIQNDCPRNVRDAWRTLAEYIRKIKIE